MEKGTSDQFMMEIFQGMPTVASPLLPFSIKNINSRTMIYVLTVSWLSDIMGYVSWLSNLRM